MRYAIVLCRYADQSAKHTHAHTYNITAMGADLAKRAGLPRAMPHPVPYALDLAGICVFNFFLRRK